MNISFILIIIIITTFMIIWMYFINKFNNKFYNKCITCDLPPIEKLLNNPINRTSNSIFINEKNHICCIYTYYEKNDNYKNNFIFFLNNGIYDDVDYYIVINGKHTVNIPIKRNIKIYNRDNIGYDFGAFSYVLKQIDIEYDYYFFINTSVRGPYLKDLNKKWTQCFIELFTQNVVVVGTTINIYPYDIFLNYNLQKIYNKKPPFTHVQSMFFCLNKQYLNYLKLINFFNEEECNDASDINYIIVYKEFCLSQIAIINKLNINSILPKYKNLNYVELNSNINSSAPNGDPYYKNAYFGDTIDKYDVIFIKTNRNL